MYRKNITYTDFDGEERTDAFYFNLTDEEILELQVEYGGNISKIMDGMLEKRDAKGLLGIITNLIKTSYGERGEIRNGRSSFTKNKELTDSFITTDAYSKLVLELLSDDKEFTNFMSNVIPVAKRESLAKLLKKQEEERKKAEEEQKAEEQSNVVELKKE